MSGLWCDDTAPEWAIEKLKELDADTVTQACWDVVLVKDVIDSGRLHHIICENKCISYLYIYIHIYIYIYTHVFYLNLYS